MAERREIINNEERFLFSSKDCCVILGAEDSLAGKWDVVPEFAQGSKRFYDIRKILSWFKRRSGQSDSTKKLAEAKRRIAESQAEKQEILTGAMRGDFMHIDQVFDILADATINFRSHMLSAPGRLSDKIFSAANKKEVRQILQADIETALQEFAEAMNAPKKINRNYIESESESENSKSIPKRNSKKSKAA